MCNDYEQHVRWAEYCKMKQDLELGIPTQQTDLDLPQADDLKITDRGPVMRAVGDVVELTVMNFRLPPSGRGGLCSISGLKGGISRTAIVASSPRAHFSSLCGHLSMMRWEGSRMRVVRVRTEVGDRFELIDEHGVVDRHAASFARGVVGRGCSPHTVAAYLYDLRRFYRFLAERGLTFPPFKLAHRVDLLAWLGSIESKRVRLTAFPAAVRTTLSPTSINRSMAAISSFFDHLVLAGEPGIDANPLATSQELARGGVARRRAALSRSARRVMLRNGPRYRPMSATASLRWRTRARPLSC